MKFNSVPAWSFAGKHSLKDRKQDDPGPGYYNSLKIQTDFKDNKKKGYTFGNSKRGNSIGESKLKIGPGQYNYDYTSIGKRGVSLKGNRRQR